MTRLNPIQRRAQILAAAIAIAKDGNLYRMTLEQVAERADISTATVIHYFRSMQGVRDAVVRDSIRQEYLPIIAQAVVGQDPLMSEVGPSLRQRAVNASV